MPNKQMATYPKVFIIIINYNNWSDTIECLESVLKNNYPDFQIILIDNNSSDNSVEHLTNWLEGRLDVWIPPAEPLRGMSHPPAAKPLTCTVIEAGTNEEELFVQNDNQSLFDARSVLLVKTQQNLGFAGANNAGIRIAMSQPDCRYVWLLNNDTVIHEKALLHLVAKAQEDDTIGITGSKLLHYEAPTEIQALGAIYYANSGGTKLIADPNKLDKVNCIVGASLLISQKCLAKVGPLPEEFFLYLEETDYCINVVSNHFKIAVSMESLVYHKSGRGSVRPVRDYYTARNTLHIVRKHNPRRLPLGFLYVVYRMILPKIVRLQFLRLSNVFSGIYDFLNGKMGPKS